MRFLFPVLSCQLTRCFRRIRSDEEEVRDCFITQEYLPLHGYKQIVNAVMEAAKVMRGECAPEDIMVKLPENKEYYGLPLVRPAALAKVCGVCDYGDDIELKMPESTLHVVMVQPKRAHHAKILKINTEEAEKMPGVYKIITHKDVKGSNRLNFFQFSKRCLATEQSHVLLAEDKIFSYGDICGAGGGRYKGTCARGSRKGYR